jgi:hypothetical protein
MSLINYDGSTYNKCHILKFFFIIFVIFLLLFAVQIVLSSRTVDYRNVPFTIFTVLGTTTVMKAKSSESFICDDTSRNRFPISSTTPSNDSFDVYRRKSLTQYCNIVPIPRSNWSKTRGYTEQDVAFVIFTRHCR